MQDRWEVAEWRKGLIEIREFKNSIPPETPVQRQVREAWAKKKAKDRRRRIRNRLILGGVVVSAILVWVVIL